MADFWRFWVVHLWVEWDFLELFTTVMVAYIFVLLGVVRQRIAIGIIFLDIILYSAGGIVGTMHHLYFSGTPVGTWYGIGRVLLRRRGHPADPADRGGLDVSCIWPRVRRPPTPSRSRTAGR